MAVVALVLASALAAGGTLLLITSLVGSERQNDTLSTIVIIVWCMLGGAFVPLEQMPSFVRPISASTLVYWATDGFATVVRGGGGIADVATNLVVLAGVGALLLGVGAWTLRRTMARGVA
jgi:ABC-2 type transport system permease protein